jgi:hypothetical protein
MSTRSFSKVCAASAAALGLALVLSAPAGAGAVSGGIADGQVWTTAAASGPVSARPPDQPQADWAAVARGDLFPPHTQIRTGHRGRATLTRQAKLIIVDPGSEIELPAGELEAEPSSVVQTSGSVLYKIDRRASAHFEVVTPYLVAGVKGTTFLVTVDERDARVTVAEGLVEITDARSGERFEVGAGQSFRASSADLRADAAERGHERLSTPPRRDAERIARMEERLDRHHPGLVGTKDESPDRFDRRAGLGDGDDALAPIWIDKAGVPDTGGDSGGKGKGKNEAVKDLLEEVISEDLHDGALEPGDPGKGSGKHHDDDASINDGDDDDDSSGPGGGSGHGGSSGSGGQP